MFHWEGTPCTKTKRRETCKAIVVAMCLWRRTVRDRAGRKGWHHRALHANPEGLSSKDGKPLKVFKKRGNIGVH